MGTWDTSIGYLHVHIPAALLRTGFLRIPSVLWLILLLAAVVLLARQLLLLMLLVVIAVAVLSSLALYLLFYWMGSRRHMHDDP